MRFISVSVRYSLACYTGGKVSIYASVMNTMKTIQDTKASVPTINSRELFSVDNLPNIVHHFCQSVLLASKGE